MGNLRAAASTSPRSDTPVPTKADRLIGRLNERGFRLVQVADVTMLGVVLVGSMVIRYGWDWPTYSMRMYGVSFVVVVGIFAAVLYFGGLYERDPRLGRPPALPRAMRQTAVAGGIVALLNLVVTGVVASLGATAARAFPVPTPNLLALILLGAVAVATNRHLSNRLRTVREGPPRVLLMGDADDAEVAMRHLDSDPGRTRVVGISSQVETIEEEVERLGATEVLLLSSTHLDALYPEVIAHLDERGVSVLLRVTGKETMFGLERIRQVGGLPFVLLRAQTLATSRAHFKRLMDLIILLVLSPAILLVLGLVALYTLAVAGRPILYWQERVGARGHTFRMAKFRTMQPDAEAQGGPQLATENDPRVVRGCGWLRATRLDELPQVYNVLRGEMSIVGPRPERPELTAMFEQQIPGYARRHELTPGLTGLAQIHGRYHTDAEYKLGYDLQYLVNWSPVLDLEILVRTVWVVLTRRI